MTPDPAALDELRALLAELRERVRGRPAVVTAEWESAATDDNPNGLRGPVTFQLPGEYVPADAATADLLDRLVAWFGLHPQERAFLRHLAEDRLSYTSEIFADWLSEQGRDAEGRRVRLLRPREGDVVVVELPAGFFYRDAWPSWAEFASAVQHSLPDNRVIVLLHGADLRALDPGQMRAAGWVRARPRRPRQPRRPPAPPQPPQPPPTGPGALYRYFPDR